MSTCDTKELLMEALARMDAEELHILYLYRKDCIEAGIWSDLLEALADLVEERLEKNQTMYPPRNY